MSDLAEWLLEQAAEDERVARECAEMFPPPWDVADRGWRVRIYAGDVPTEDLSSDDPDAMMIRNPVVMEVEPNRHIEDTKWLSERVEHVRRHDPARVLRQVEALRRVVDAHPLTMFSVSGAPEAPTCWLCAREYSWGKDPGVEEQPCPTLRALAAIYADRPGWQEGWAL